ncbi:MAG TPA: vWA domain-containing protein, partial [Fimbriimonas sp.]|nr:vWA domain-containing protein [Fimbriimonas sp.]
MLRPLAILYGAFVTALASAQFGTAWIQPKELYDIEVAQTRLSDNIYLENNTRLFLSAQISSLEEQPKILVPHVGLEVRDSVPIIADANLIGPQGSLLSGGWSTVMRYDQPRGKNASVSVITAGVSGDFSQMTEDEVRLHNLLLGRFLFDQFFVPGINWICGVKLDSKAASGVIAGMITGHNSQIIEQFRDACRSGSATEVMYAMWQFIVREVETGGPIASYITRKFGVNLAEKMAERIARKIAISFIPGANAVEKMLWALNTGGTTTNMVPAVLDVQSTPSKINFNVYFNAGVGGVFPGVIRIDGADDEISIHGHKLVPIPGKPFLVRAYDKATGKFHEIQNPHFSSTGRAITFKLPESAIGNRRGPLRFDVVVDKQVLHCPGTVQIIQDLVVHRLEPSHGPPGTRVRIIGDGVYPYTRTNTVLMKLPGELTATRAPAELVSREWLEFVVPANMLVDTKTNYEVFVEERHGSTRKESRHLTFTVDPGTYEQARQKHREEAMPEGKFSVKGTLDDATPARTHLFDAPAGMQVEVELKSVLGPNESQTVGELEYWNVSLISSPPGATLKGYAVTDPIQNVRSGLPAQRITHTTQSIPGQNKYGISVRKKSKEAVSYLFEVRFIRRDDALSGADAGHSFEHALPIRNNERYNSRISTEQRRYGEDIKDFYRIEGIADDNEIVVKVSGAPTTYPFAKDEGTIRGVTLYCQGETDAEPYPVAWHEASLGVQPTTANFVHSTNGNRRYFVEVEGGAANTEYWIEVLVRPAIPPPVPLEPIVSTFFRDDEGWQLSGNFQTGTRKPEHFKFEGGGYIHDSDALPEQTVGPLDVMVAVDTTGSMGGSIASVRDSTVRIIEELRRRTSSLRVGLVSFKDVAADGAGSRSIVPLSPNIEQSLA